MPRYECIYRDMNIYQNIFFSTYCISLNIGTQMLNNNHVADIRTCERIKFDQALYILTMYQKKIRTQIKFDQSNEIIDAEKEYDQKIVRSWNSKWKMDLTKPLLNCVTSISPRILLDIKSGQQQLQQQMSQDQQQQIIQKQQATNDGHYNRVMLQFIRRMRVEHEDQSNFKLTEVDVNVQGSGQNRFRKFAEQSFHQFMAAIQMMFGLMLKSVEDNAATIEQEIEEGDNYILSIGSRLEDLKEQVTRTIQMKQYQKQQLFRFIAANVSIFDKIRQSEQGSTLIAVQPKLNQFTYILHPLFFPIYASLLKQKQQQRAQKQKQENKQQKQMQQFQTPFKHFFSSNTASLSKIVFINLDGYESQFNLEFARCFKRNMMYISFPKEDIHSANDQNSVYQQRLYKKIMYNWEKNKMRYMGTTQAQYEADRKYFMNFNIEDYYANVQKVLYRFDNAYEDLNSNMFVFPLRLPTLNQNFNNMISEEQYDTIQVYQSAVISQIFKYFLVNQIKQFGPTYIIVSHSGRLHIEDSDFVEIMQELTKLSHYKVVYFPNLTKRFCPQQKRGIDHELDIKQIDYMQRYGNGQHQDISFQFFNKIARFLKVSSGTYSLVKNFQQKNMLSKHLNLRVLKKVNKLMEVLGNQYDNIDRIRFKNSEIEMIPKLYEKDAQKLVKAFDKLVPSFYSQLYLLLESIISLCYLPQSDPKAQNILLKYNYNPKLVRTNHVFRELKDFLASRPVIRNSKNERQKMLQIFEKMIKFIQCQREKHFMEISEQKYEDSVLFYFKNSSNIDLYDSTIQGKPNLTGLIDVSFSSPNKQSKQSFHIFESTQVLYKLDRTQRVGPIPILIMNHLPLDRKNISKFDNYCAFLSKEILKKLSTIKTAQQGAEKINEEKKVKLYPIKLFDDENRQIIESKFCVRTEWNYCQTQNYLIFFWPQLFDFVQALSCRLMGRNYQPPILNQFYMAKKQVKNDSVNFYRTVSPDNLAPRSGCSAYQFQDSIYILGGFYEKTNNYLSLQRDVTMMDLSTYVHDGERKLNIVNLKSQLYEPINQRQQQEETKTNSYVRPRREYQFYNKSDVCLGFVPEQGIRSVLMIGGVGQNFIHPFSLITYYYYELKIDEQTRRLLSIKRNIVYNRSIPVNVSKPSKNMGIIKTPIRNKNEGNGKTIMTKPQLTQPNSYARFRIVYKMQDGQLKYRFQFIFSEKDCQMLKQQFRKFGEQKAEIGDPSDVRIEKINGNNHCFSIEKHSLKQVVHLRLEREGTNQYKDQHFKLTHESVIFLHIIGTNYVCALIKHPVFTNDKTILADCQVKNLQNQNSTDQQVLYVSLRPFQQELQGDLTLHIIQASNTNLIYILHGHRLFRSNKINEYLITNNKLKKTKLASKIAPKAPIPYLQQKSIPKFCYSTFFYKSEGSEENDIICDSYLAFQEEGNVVTKISQCFNPTDPNLRWVASDVIVKYVFCLPNTNNAISLVRLNFLEFYKSEARGKAFRIEYKQTKYIAKINPQNMEIMGEQVRVELTPETEQENQKLEQQYTKGNILVKKPQFYEDRGYDMAE